MLRQIIHIDEEKCNGCGLCAKACHENAIEIIDGKARLIRDDYCDGMGDCLPNCPQGAISFEIREAKAYDEKAVELNKKKNMMNWPVQIKLAPIQADCFNQANLVIAADCTAYAYKDFYSRFRMENTVLIGCPKLDSIDYSMKLSEIIRNNDIQRITIVRMEVPCCGGLERAVTKALLLSGKALECNVVTISMNGNVLD